jgi:SsrA-binding protein
MAKTIHVNKRAGFNYHLDDTYIAGLVLEGWEAKSLEKGKVNLEHAYVKIINGEVFLIGAQVVPMATATVSSANILAKPDITRTRKLLLSKSEIDKLIGAVQRRGFTVIPLAVLKDRKFRLKIALAKGKDNADKRADAKAKDADRELAQMAKKAVRG